MSESVARRVRMRTIRAIRPPLPRRTEGEIVRGLSRQQLAEQSNYVRGLIRIIDSHKLCINCGDPFQPRDERVRYCGKCGGGA